MNTDKAVEAIAGLIEGQINKVPVLRYEKGKKVTGDYIVVNALQVVYTQAVGTFYCNINVHTKDDIKGEPRIKEAFEMSEIIAGENGIFKEPVFKEGNWFTLYTMSGPFRDSDTTHYINIQIEVNFSNI